MKMEAASEVRRLRVVYFLSHMGRADHPHLLRVHHQTRNGVFLRDVKRWLGDLRGKDMPESYAWSYKRRYKTGYVWQDLLDDDLITPLSDNEFVLKGSAIIVSPDHDEKADIAERKKPDSSAQTEKPIADSVGNLRAPDSTIDPPSQIFSEINDEASSSFESDRSSLTEEADQTNPEADKQPGETAQSSRQPSKHRDRKIETNSAPYFCRYPPPMDAKSVSKSRKSQKDSTGDGEVKRGVPSRSKTSSQPQLPAKVKSFSGGLRNFITCGAVDTDEAAFVTLRRCSNSDAGNFMAARSSNGTVKEHGEARRRDVVKAWDRKGEDRTPQRRSASSRRSEDEKKNRKRQQSELNRASLSAYRPTGEPNCLQCGKSFRPEKLHSHMKSCRGIKVNMCGTSAEKTTEVSQHHSAIYKESALGRLLTNK